MNNLIEDARKRAGLTQEQARRLLFLGTVRQYQRLKDGEISITPEMAVRIADAFNCPTLTMVYCRQNCEIGRRYAFDILNNVDLSPMAILAKYRQEEREANEALEKLADLMLNKHSKNDCSELELKELWRWSLEMLDVEHVIETLKLRLWDFLDVAALVRNHNLKCLEKRYVDEKKPELSLAG